MSLIKFIKTWLIIITLLAVFTSCEKDKVSTTGSVKVTFTNHPTDLTAYFSPVDNTQIAITDWLKPDNNGTLTYDLNIGNYILTCSGSTFFPKVGFQIRAGETTQINYDSTNEGHVQ